MATLEQIGAALKAADAAGNVDDARKLAQAYKAMKAQSAGAPQQGDGVMANIGAGIDNAANSFLGSPVDVPRAMINSVTQPREGENLPPSIGPDAALRAILSPLKLPAIPEDVLGGRQWWEGVQKSLGFTPPSEVEAVTLGEKMARGGSEAVTSFLLPGAIVSRGAKAADAGAGGIAPTMQALEPFLGAGMTPGRIASNAATAGAAGVGATAAAEMAPDEYKPLASILGGLAAATPVAVVTSGPSVVRQATQPLSQAGRERGVAQWLDEAAMDPVALRKALQNPREIVPGSKPTTFQASGDMGVGALERGVSNSNAELFNTRRAEQNMARVRALEAIQPTGAPEEVTSAIRASLKAVSDDVTKATNALRTDAAKRAADIGVARTPDAAGDSIRANLAKRAEEAEIRERALWEAVDPDGSLAVPPTKAITEAKALRQRLPASARQPRGEEAEIYALLDQYGPVVPFNELQALHSRLKTAIRDEAGEFGNPQAHMRLSMLNAAVFDDLGAAIQRRVAQEKQAVETGVMSDMDTMAARFQAKVNSWRVARDERVSQIAGQDFGGGNGAADTVRAAFVPAGSRGGSSSRGGPRNPPGDPRLSGEGLEPNFDAEALDRLTAAREATVDNVNRFGNRTLSPILSRPATNVDFSMPSGAVPEQFFREGPRSYAAIQQLRKAVGDQQAIGMLEGYVITKLRRAAAREDGTLDAGKVRTFINRHADAFRAFPELRQRLENAGRSTDRLDQQITAGKRRVDEAQDGIAGRLLRTEDPADIPRVIGGIFSSQNAATTMHRLRKQLGDNKVAKEGLRKAVADYVMRYVGNTEAGTSGVGTIKSDQFQTFVKQNAPAIRAAGFTDQDLARLMDIAEDLQRGNRSITSSKIPGGSDTAQNMLTARGKDSPMSIAGWSSALAGAGAGGATIVAGPLLGIPLGIAAGLGNAWRRAGINKMEDLLVDALLNPERARYLLAKVKPGQAKRNVNMVKHLIGLYTKAAVAAGATQ